MQTHPLACRSTYCHSGSVNVGGGVAICENVVARDSAGLGSTPIRPSFLSLPPPSSHPSVLFAIAEAAASRARLHF